MLIARVPGVLGVLASVALLCGSAAEARPSLASAPSSQPNPNERAPLVALLNVEAGAPARAMVGFECPVRRWQVEFPSAPAGKRALPILGLRADTAHRVRVRLADDAGVAGEWSRWLDYRTPPLPAGAFEFPPLQVTRADVSRMEPGYTLLSIRRAPIGRSSWRTREQQRFARAWGLIVVLDPEGHVVWYYVGDSRFAGVKQLSNGNLLVHRADSTTTELDMRGTLVRQWYPEKRPPLTGSLFAGTMLPDAIPIRGLEALHHQPFEMPNGNFLSFGAYGRRIPNYYTSETDPAAPRAEQLVVGDRVIEFDRTGRIVWQWDTFDHLDPFRIGYELTASYWQTRGFPGGLDWTHGNGVAYDPRTGVVLASFRHQDATIAIDRRSGRIRWILGEPTDWGPLADKVLRPVGPLRWPYHAHNPRFTHAGTVIMFDNGTWGARPFRKPIEPVEHFSRSVEFEIDERAMTVRQVWTSADRLSEDTCSAIAMSDAWRLPKTDNILEIAAICSRNRPGMTWNDQDWTRPNPQDQAPNASRVREYTRTSPSEILFEVLVRDPRDLIAWELYGGQRIPALYPATWGRSTAVAGSVGSSGGTAPAGPGR
ncbi:MAG: aryl-sulfate sulfotransferase [Pseudomonadota bacterium]